MADQKMLDKRVLVTGSGTGIGKGVAREMARHGAAVALHYSQSSEGAIATVEEIHKEGGKAEAFHANFTDIDETKQLARDAFDFLGGIDILINNSGITLCRPFLEVTPAQYDTLLNVNVRSMYFLTQAATPLMVEQGKGSVINLTSVHAYQGMHEHSVYATTKGAIVAMTRQLAVELGPKKIRVNAIAPGCIVVENYALASPEMDLDGIAYQLPVGHVGAPTDIANLAMFLASDEARFITGQTYVIDGGQLAVMGSTDAFRNASGEQWGARYVPST